MSFDPADHQWVHRVLYVFAPTDAHPHFLAQRQTATGFDEGFRERDLLFVAVLEEGESLVDGQHAIDAASVRALRERYEVAPGTFAVVLVGKDGAAKRRSAEPVPPSALFGQIDQMPMRQREMRERR